MVVATLGMDGHHYAPRWPGGLQHQQPSFDQQQSYDPYSRQVLPSTSYHPSYRAAGHRPNAGFFQGGRSYGAQSSQRPQKRKFDAPPMLNELRQDNLKKARRHFQGSLGPLSAPGSTPRTAPRAPDNRHGFLLAPQGSIHLSQEGQGGLHAVTPSVPGAGEAVWKNSWGNADKEAVALAAAAGLDFLGSFYDGDDTDLDLGGASDADAGEAEPPVQEAEAPPPTFDDEASFPPQAKRKLASQAAYIAQLEEQTLTLRERIFLLEQQLAEAQQRRGASPSGRSGDEAEGSDDDRATSSSSD